MGEEGRTDGAEVGLGQKGSGAVAVQAAKLVLRDAEFARQEAEELRGFVARPANEELADWAYGDQSAVQSDTGFPLTAVRNWRHPLASTTQVDIGQLGTTGQAVANFVCQEELPSKGGEYAVATACKHVPYVQTVVPPQQ